MRTRVVTGNATEIPDAMQACHRGTTVALVVTVANVVDQARVVNTQLRLTGIGLDGAIDATTSDAGVFTILVEELQVGSSLVAQEANFVVATTDGADSYALVFADIPAGTDGTALAYFGALYEIRLLRGGEVVPQAATRDGQYEIVVDGGDAELREDDPWALDQAYRLVIRDDYSLIDNTDQGLLGPSGDNTSKPASYDANGWTRYVSPAVPLRVVVRKKRAGAYRPILADEVKIRWSVIDPPAAFVQENRPRAPLKPRTFLTEVYALLRGAQPLPGHGNKNCPRKFGGLRENDGGVNASSVLFTSTGGWQALAAVANTDATSAVVPDGQDATIARSDVFFAPKAIGGDSYRFVIKLLNGQDEELRFAPLPDTVPAPSITTGIVTVWRRIQISLLLQLEIEDGTIWDEVEAAYAAAYILLRREDPLTIYQNSIDQRIWDIVGHDYNGWPGGNLMPDLRLREAEIFAHVETVVHGVIADLAPRNWRADPNVEPVPPYGVGLYIVACANLFTDSHHLGLYMGKGQFFSVQIRDVTSTFIHEMGHALYLRHCLSAHDRRRKPALGWVGNSDTRFHLVPNSNFFDHDPLDAVSCFMSYTNEFHHQNDEIAVQSHFCGMCLLKLRMWDTVLMANDGAFRPFLISKYAAQAAEIVVIHDPDQGDDCWNGQCVDCWNCRPAHQISVPQGSTSHVRGLVNPDATRNNFDWESWIDITARGQWTSSDEGVVTVDADGLLTAVGQGAANVTFTFNNLQVVSQLQVGVALDAFSKIHPWRLRIGDYVVPQQPNQNDDDVQEPVYVEGAPANEVDGVEFTVRSEDDDYLVRVHGGKSSRPQWLVFCAVLANDRQHVVRWLGIPVHDAAGDWEYTVAPGTFRRVLEQSRYGDENGDCLFIRYVRPDGSLGTAARR